MSPKEGSLATATPGIPSANATKAAGRRASPTLATTIADLLPLCDFAGLLLAAYFSLYAYAAATTLPAQAGDALYRLAWVAAGLAPFILYQPHFAASAGAGALLRGFARRFLVLFGIVCAFALAGRWLEQAPHGWLALWLALSLLITGGSRVIMAHALRRLALQGLMAQPKEVIGPRVGDSLPVTLLADRPIRRWNAVLKASSDYLMGVIATVLLLPVLAGIALAIRLDSPGPVLFTQRRHGYNNGEFDIYKFRTMRATSDSSVGALQQTVRGDARITRVGRFLRKWSLDELPQVFNVLRGEMSLVGPRPHAVDMRTEQRYGHEITDFYAHRHRVKPGITGWAQINGSRGATDTVEQLRRRVELDLYYVDHWSPLLDLKIIALTFRVVLRATNAY